MNKKIENKDSILKDIAAYNKKLQKKIKDPEMERLKESVERYEDRYFTDTGNVDKVLGSSHMYKETPPPYPFLVFYQWMIFDLRNQLERNLRSLVFEILWDIGNDLIDDYGTGDMLDIPDRLELPENLVNIVNDQKFNKIRKEINSTYNIGCVPFKENDLPKPDDDVITKAHSMERMRTVNARKKN